MEAAPVCKTIKIDEELVNEVKGKMLDEDTFQRLGNLYSVFSDPLRTKILYLLFEHPMCVCDIAEILGSTQSNISHHLAILRDHELVSFTRCGKQVIYSLKDEHVQLIIKMGLEHIMERRGN